MKYVKKPIVVEAYQITGTLLNPGWPPGWLTCPFELVRDVDGYSVLIDTLEGQHKGSKGDYIIKGIQGEFYPCKPDIFIATYEKYLDTTKE